MATVRLIVRRQSEADPTAGFRVTLDARDLGREDLEGTLPPLPAELAQALADWKQAYAGQAGVRSHFRIAAIETTQRTVRETNALVEAIERGFQAWLRSMNDGWLRIRETLAVLLHQHAAELRLILDLGGNTDLKRLPWQDWDLLGANFRHADAAFRLVNDGPQQQLTPTYPRSTRVRILVVIGESTGINTAQDLASILQLQHNDPDRVEVVPLLQPTPDALQRALEDPAGYHIFIYVGHSYSHSDGQNGSLLLNDQDELSIRDFQRALRHSLERGLQLIIFNSCDGLGLAQQMARLDAPRCIVMKEPIPDDAAVEFIDRFFQQFVGQGQPLQAAVRRARQGLEAYNSRYSEVTWLPTVCIKQNTPPLTWQTLLAGLPPAVRQPAGGRRMPLPAPAAGASPSPAGSPGGGRWRRWALVAGGGAALLGALALATTILPRPSTPKGFLDVPRPAEGRRLISSGGNLALAGNPPLAAPYADLKRAGIAAFAEGDYGAARNSFLNIRADARAERDRLEAIPAGDRSDADNAALSAAREALLDPTVLIFQNNAEVRRRQAQTGEIVYTIAAAVPLEGQAADIGREMLRGVAQIQDQTVNGGGPEGLPRVNLEVVIANDGNRPDQAAAAAAALTQPGPDGGEVLAVVGHYLSGTTCAALTHAYNSANLVVVSPLSTQSDLRQQCGPSPGSPATTFFRNTSSNAVEARTLVNHLDQLGLANPGAAVAVFYRQGEPYSDDLFGEFQRSLADLGVEIAQTFDLADARFEAAAALAQVPDVAALVVIPDGRNASNEAFDQAIAVLRQNAGQKVVLASNPLYNQGIIEPAGGLPNLTNRVFIATDWHRDCAPDPFNDAIARYWIGGVNRTTTLPYEAVQALLPYLQGDITAARLRQRLDGLAVTSNTPVSQIFQARTTISFDENGDRRELAQRILTTFGTDPDNPLVPVGGCPTPANPG